MKRSRDNHGVVLLVVLFCLNAVAIYFRNKYEKKW